jgi:hypothetical protein
MNVVSAKSEVRDGTSAEICGGAGDILLAQRPGSPALRVERSERQIFLSWEEPDGVPYVPQFTTHLDGSGIWRPILVPPRRTGTIRRVQLQPYCHARLFRLEVRPVAVRSLPASPPRIELSWWRRLLDWCGWKPVGELAHS